MMIIGCDFHTRYQQIVPPLSAFATTNNQLSSTGFSFDASGNMLTDGVNTYGWNAESEIKSAASVNYTYDGNGNRLEKSNGEIYWYGAGTEILDESSLSGSFTNEYVFFGGKRIALRNVSSGAIYYYAEDMLGSSRTMMQAGQTSVCYDADFYPFGGERDIVSTCSQNYKFEGKERDTETNNDDFGARYYSSRFGRWLSADWSAIPEPVPYANLTNPQTLNLYAIVSDNPETFVDLDGHEIYYDDGLQNAQLVQDSVEAILADPNTSASLSGYVGSDDTNLIIRSGDLSAGDTRQVSPDGQTVTTTTVQGNTDISGLQTTTFTENGTTSPPVTSGTTVITIDNRTSQGDTPGVMVHEGVHAGEARANPSQFGKDAAAEKKANPNCHDCRPQEQRANTAQKAYSAEIKKAVKRREKERKKLDQREKKKKRES